MTNEETKAVATISTDADRVSETKDALRPQARRFSPIKIAGEPLSETILRDRGPR